MSLPYLLINSEGRLSSDPSAVTRQSESFAHDTDVEWEDIGDGIRRKILIFEGRFMMAGIAFKVVADGVAHRHHHIQCSYVGSGEFW